MPEQPNAETRLAAIVASSEDAIISRDAAGMITSWNAAAERMFRYTAAEALGQSNLWIIPPERFAEENDVWQRIRAGETVDHYETVRVAKDGHRVELSLSVSPLKDPEGRVIGASQIARDVGERSRLERAATHFAAIIDSSDDAIISKDLDGTIRSWNRAAEQLLGYSANEVIGKIHSSHHSGRLAGRER